MIFSCLKFRICSYCCSLAKSCPALCNPHKLQYARLPFPPLSPGACSNSCPLSQWCHPTISSSVAPFSFCPQPFPASGSFPLSWLFTSGGQSIGASVSVSALPMNIQGWFSLGLPGLILQSKGFQESFPAQFESNNSLVLSLLYGLALTSIYGYWKNHSFDYMDLCWQSEVSAFLILSFKPGFSLSSFTLIKRLFSPSSLVIRVVSSVYLRLLIFLLAVLIPACDSFQSGI